MDLEKKGAILFPLVLRVWDSGAMPEGMIGRERELEAAAGFLSELKDGLTVLVIAGEPGIGKTTVWRDTVGRARALSFVVLSAQPVEAEAGLAFAGLADLLEPVAEEVLPQLPEPQRRAVEVALSRADPGSGRVDQRAVSAGTAAVLSERLVNDSVCGWCQVGVP